MKKLITLFSLVLTFISCEEEVFIDNLKSIEPKLVIEANIFWNKDLNTATQEQVIRLTQSTDFYDTPLVFVNNATIQLTDSKGNPNGTFVNQGEGNYVATDFTEPVEGETYTLTINHDNNIYTGTHEYQSITDVEFVEEREQDLFGEKTIQLTAKFQNEANVDNFYFAMYQYINLVDNDPLVLFKDFDETQHELITEFDVGNDNFTNETPGDNLVEAVYFFEETPKKGQEFKIILTGVSSRYEVFIRKFLLNIGENNGPADTPPAIIKGNMFNTTNPDNFPQGFFAMGQSTEFTYIIGSNIISN